MDTRAGDPDECITMLISCSCIRTSDRPSPRPRFYRGMTIFPSVSASAKFEDFTEDLTEDYLPWNIGILKIRNRVVKGKIYC